MAEIYVLIIFLWLLGALFTFGFGAVDEDKRAEEIIPSYGDDPVTYQRQQKIAKSGKVIYFIMCLIIWPPVLGEATRKAMSKSN